MNYTYYRRYRPRQKRSGFKSFFWLVVVLVLLSFGLKACVSVFHNILEDKRNEAVLSIISGDVSIKLWGQEDFEDAANTQIVLEGDTVKTGEDGLVSLLFHNGTKLNLDHDSTIVFVEMTTDGENDEITLDLLDGRAWLDHLPKDQGEMNLVVRTDVMNVSSLKGKCLISNIPDEEYVYSFDGNMSVDFMQRSDEDILIDSMIISEGSKSFIDDSKQRALLNRENLVLVEDIVEDELLGDEFYMWNIGTFEIEIEDVEEDVDVEVEADEVVEDDNDSEEDEIEEDEPIEETVGLKISVTSGLDLEIGKDAIAIEGQIISGEASKVTVTWSGSNVPFALSLFEPGDLSFRYVADYEYSNLSRGDNTYIVRAYDVDGNMSNEVFVHVYANF